MDSYFLSIDEDILLSARYGIKDESNNLARKIVLNSISKFDSKFVKHYETTKEMNLYLRGNLHFSEMEKNAKNSTFIAVTN